MVSNAFFHDPSGFHLKVLFFVNLVICHTHSSVETMEGTLLSRCPCSNLPSPSTIPYPASLPILHPMIFEFRERLWADLSHKLGVLHSRLLLQFSSALYGSVSEMQHLHIYKTYITLFHPFSLSCWLHFFASPKSIPSVQSQTRHLKTALYNYVYECVYS